MNELIQVETVNRKAHAPCKGPAGHVLGKYMDPVLIELLNFQKMKKKNLLFDVKSNFYVLISNSQIEKNTL